MDAARMRQRQSLPSMRARFRAAAS